MKHPSFNLKALCLKSSLLLQLPVILLASCLALPNSTRAEDPPAKLGKEARQKRDQDRLNKGLAVNEWGSLSLVQDSKNAILDGFTENQSDLPPFVQMLSPSKAIQNIQMIEKPILYFYSGQKMVIQVSIKCPNGIFTQWWPRATRVTPNSKEYAQMLSEPEASQFFKDGSLQWMEVSLDPENKGPYEVVPEGSWWPTARDTDSTPLSVRGKFEKFLFYRGTTDNPLFLVGKADETGSITIKNTCKEVIPHLWIIHVENGRIKSEYIESVTPDSSIKKNMNLDDKADPVETAAPKLKAQMQETLEEAGLFEKEAKGMAAIWEKDYFQRDGLRYIYMMTRQQVDDLLPLTIQPAPASTERVLLVRMECMTHATETKILKLISSLGAEEFKIREAAESELRAMDRYPQALMRRELEKADDPEVKHRLKRILTAISAPKSK